ncbi:MAG: hypothetical protein D8G53_03145 [Candidatus Saccharimonas sp.]|nr:MAG: hypothetical protein D8G53_03145 [Candidatus Saccharimonas sp.]
MDRFEELKEKLEAVYALTGKLESLCASKSKENYILNGKILSDWEYSYLLSNHSEEIEQEYEKIAFAA